MPVGTSCTLTVDRDGKRKDFKLVVQDRVKVFWDDPRVVGEAKTVPTANTEEEKPEVSKVVPVRHQRPRPGQTTKRT